MRIAAALIYAIAAWAQAPEDDHGSLSLDVRLRLIVQAARERFRPIITYRVDMRPRGKSWFEVKYELPQATTCRVFEQPELVYVCEWGRGPKAPLFANLAKQVEDALGAGWKRTDGAGPRKKARFDSKDERNRDAALVVEETESGLKVVVYPL